MDRSGGSERSWGKIGRGRGWAGQPSRAHSQAPGPIRIMDAEGRVLRTLDPRELPMAGGFHEEADARARKRAQQARRGGRRAHHQPERDTEPDATVSPAESLSEPAWTEAEVVPEEPSEDHAG